MPWSYLRYKKVPIWAWLLQSTICSYIPDHNENEDENEKRNDYVDTT